MALRLCNSRYVAPSTSYRPNAPRAQSRGSAQCRRAAEVDPIVERLHPCEASGDWATVVEVLTEARMEQRTLQPAALEISSRILCKGGQWQRALTVFQSLQDVQHKMEPETVESMFQALYSGQQADRAFQLWEELKVNKSECAGLASNIVIRTLSISGEALKAYGVLEKITFSDDRELMEHGTYTTVAKFLLKANEMEKAEEVFEWRDYI